VQSLKRIQSPKDLTQGSHNKQLAATHKQPVSDVQCQVIVAQRIVICTVHVCTCMQDKDASKRITAAALPSTPAATDTTASAETTDKPEATETVTII
jgi:hypothetical protein